MQKIYMISENFPASWEGHFNMSKIMFVFTSKKKAIEQIRIIKQRITEGGWWSDKNGNVLTGEIISDESTEDRWSYQRDLIFISPNGQKCLYRLEMFDKVNSGYGF